MAAGQYYEDIIDELATDVLAKSAALPSGTKYMVGIAGAPGSGKTTLAQLVCQRINQLAAKQHTQQPVAVVVPMDGFHYYKHELDQMPDPKVCEAAAGAAGAAAGAKCWL